MKSEQVNLRFSKEAIKDIEFVSKQLKIDRSEWLRYDIMNVIKKRKDEVIKKLENSWVNGLISEAYFKKIAGQELSEHARLKKESYKENARKALLMNMDFKANRINDIVYLDVDTLKNLKKIIDKEIRVRNK